MKKDGDSGGHLSMFDMGDISVAGEGKKVV
jgi:hypothetical protein